MTDDDLAALALGALRNMQKDIGEATATGARCIKARDRNKMKAGTLLEGLFICRTERLQWEADPRPDFANFPAR